MFVFASNFVVVVFSRLSLTFLYKSVILIKMVSEQHDINENINWIRVVDFIYELLFKVQEWFHLTWHKITKYTCCDKFITL